MDGKLNCSMNAENAAFTKIRHLENRVVEAETRLDVLEQETTQLDGDLQDALTGLEEKVETAEVDTTSLSADNIDAVNITADNVNALDITTTTIEAETIDVDNLQNVNALHGQTVDVARTIADIGQFQETQTTTANNGTTNTEELNVSTEANLTGQVNIDGNMTFTKDNGLSKLQGNYLEIDAANVVIDNKNSAEYALYVPGVDGDALFGGSVAVQDTLAAKNLIVAEEAHFSNLTLNENTILENPTLERIAQTEELTDKALDIDENGKIVRKFVAGGSTGTVANALIANETYYNYSLADKYKLVEENANRHIVLSDTADFTFNSSSEANAYLENSNGLRYEFENSQTTGSMMYILSIVHNNIFYVIVPTTDNYGNITSAELRKINLNNMQVEYSIDVSEYFRGSLQSLSGKITWLPIMYGNILSEDKPVLAIANTNKYFDLKNGELLTRSQNFNGGIVHYLSKTDTWYTLTGNTADSGIWATNNKYASIEDTAQINEPYLENDIYYIVDAPVIAIGNSSFKWINGGIINTLSYDRATQTVLCRDENNNNVSFEPSRLIFNGVEYDTNLYNSYGYVVNKYVGVFPYQVEKVKIDRTQADFTDVPVTAENITSETVTAENIVSDNITSETITINDKATIEDIETSTIDAEVVKTIDAEVDGMTFYEGEWYDAIISTKEELITLVNNNLASSRKLNVLYTGSGLAFTAADDFSGAYYASSDHHITVKAKSTSSVNIMGENALGVSNKAAYFFGRIKFVNFSFSVDIVNCSNIEYLSIKDGALYLDDYSNLFADTTPSFHFMNLDNVNVSVKFNSTIAYTKIDIRLEDCYLVTQGSGFYVSDTSVLQNVIVRIDDSDRCSLNIGVASNLIALTQYRAGSNNIFGNSVYVTPVLKP